MQRTCLLFCLEENTVSVFQGCNQNYPLSQRRCSWSPSKAICDTSILEKVALNKDNQLTLLISHVETWKAHEELSPKNIHLQFFNLPGFWRISLSMPFCRCLWLIWWMFAVTKSIQLASQNLLKVMVFQGKGRGSIMSSTVPYLTSTNPYKRTRSTLKIQVDFSLSFYIDLSSCPEILIQVS